MLFLFPLLFILSYVAKYIQCVPPVSSLKFFSPLLVGWSLSWGRTDEYNNPRWLSYWKPFYSLPTYRAVCLHLNSLVHIFSLDYIADIALLFSGFECCIEPWCQTGLLSLGKFDLVFLPETTGFFFSLYWSIIF